mgnify:CR=1 FL=1
MLEQFSNHKLQLFLTPTSAIASRMRWQLLESNSIAKPKMSIGVIRSIRQELELWA